MAVISATDYFSHLYQNDNNSDNNSEVSIVEDVVDDLTYDIHNLAAFNYHSIQYNDTNKEQVILANTQRGAQLVFKRILECPTTMTDIGKLVDLPSETSRLPRSTKIPEKAPETTWEKFAREKGIKKKKRDRMVYDEDSDEFKPRFGYKRVKNGLEDIPIVEVKKGQDPFSDPWAEDRSNKKDRVKKNLKQQIKNQGKALRIKGVKSPKNGMKKYDPENVPGIPMDIDQPMKRGKSGVRSALQLVQQSTASMGRFDTMRDGEPIRKLKGKKRSFRTNVDSTENDK
eukprot:gene16463-22454_t